MVRKFDYNSLLKQIVQLCRKNFPESALQDPDVKKALIRMIEIDVGNTRTHSYRLLRQDTLASQFHPDTTSTYTQLMTELRTTLLKEASIIDPTQTAEDTVHAIGLLTIKAGKKYAERTLPWLKKDMTLEKFQNLFFLPPTDVLNKNLDNLIKQSEKDSAAKILMEKQGLKKRSSGRGMGGPSNPPHDS